MKLKYFIQNSYEQLFNNVEDNLPKYTSESPWVESYFGDFFDAETNIDVHFCELINSPQASKDLDNVKILYSSLNNLTTEQAMDGRLWAHLAHVEYWKYMRVRWSVNNADPEDPSHNPTKRIQSRYFLSSENSRSLIRNGIARLWWFGHLTYERHEDDPFVLTKTLLDYQDIQAALLERNLGKNKDVLRICLKVLAKHMDDIRANGGRDVIKALGKYVNLLGGTYFLDTMDKSMLQEKINSFIERKLKGE